MRGHKFLIIVGDSYAMKDVVYMHSAEVVEQLVWNEIEHVEVITCAHEAFADNVIVISNPEDSYECYSVVRDVNGRLWYFTDWHSKNSIVAAFEQKD